MKSDNNLTLRIGMPGEAMERSETIGFPQFVDFAQPVRHCFAVNCY
jgi:hypothetical protein